MPQTSLGGASFSPSARQDDMGPDARRRMANPVQESVQTLRMRLPKVFGARAPVSRDLMGGAGGMGQFGGGGNALVAQVLAALAGVRPGERPGGGQPLPIQHMGAMGTMGAPQAPRASAAARGGASPFSAAQPASIFSQPLPVNVGVTNPSFPNQTVQPIGPPLPSPGRTVTPPPAQSYAGVGPTAAENPSDPTTWLSPYERINGPYQGGGSQGYFDGDGNWIP